MLEESHLSSCIDLVRMSLGIPKSPVKGKAAACIPVSPLWTFRDSRKPNDDVRNSTPKAESEIAQKLAKRI
jgi:hypothetical protein